MRGQLLMAYLRRSWALKDAKQCRGKNQGKRAPGGRNSRGKGLPPGNSGHLWEQKGQVQLEGQEGGGRQ